MTFDEYKARAKADLDAVFEAGKAQGGDGDNYRKLFWDTYQNNGNPTYYNYAFAYSNWTDETFFPEHNIVATSCNGMFHTSSITRLKSKLDEQGVIFDVSQCTSLLQMFQNSSVKDIPIIDGSNATNMSYTFGSRPAVETIEKLILSNKLTTVNNAFSNAEKLRHVIFEGELAITGLDLHDSKILDAESYNSLMNILSPNTNGMSIVLTSYDTVQMTFDTTYGTGAWDSLVAEKSNWTIVYN